jgi:hypothetical protein
MHGVTMKFKEAGSVYVHIFVSIMHATLPSN